MNKGDIITYSYRKRIDGLLENQSDLDLFDPLNQVELDEIWEEISTEMDIDEVWKNISYELDTVAPVDSSSDLITKALAIVLIILIGLVPVKKAIIDTIIRSKPDVLTETRHNEQSAASGIRHKGWDSITGKADKPHTSPTSKSSSAKSEVGTTPIPTADNRPGPTQEKTVHLSNEAISEDLTASEIANSGLVVSTDKINGLFKTDFDSFKADIDLSTSGSSLQSTDNKRISLGLTMSYRNTWLLNHETLSGLKSESLNTTEIVFFPDVGLSMNYSFNNSWLLQADGFFSSNSGQEYFDYIYGVYSRKKITLTYSTIALSVKHKFMIGSNCKLRPSINVLAGFYSSVLHYAYQEVNTDLKSIGSEYSKFDLGVRLGGEYELQIFDHFSIDPGLFLSIGIPNIYKGNDYIPGYFRRTHNGSIGFYIAGYYHFE